MANQIENPQVTFSAEDQVWTLHFVSELGVHDYYLEADSEASLEELAAELTEGYLEGFTGRIPVYSGDRKIGSITLTLGEQIGWSYL